MRELFVYYGVPQGAAAAALAAVVGAQAALRAAHPGLVARLLRRSEAATQPETWMETYALPGSIDGIDMTLQAGIEAAAAPLRRLLDGNRHVEAFEVLMSEKLVSPTCAATPVSRLSSVTGLDEFAGA